MLLLLKLIEIIKNNKIKIKIRISKKLDFKF